MRIVYITGLLLLGVLILVFSVLNAHPVVFHYFFGEQSFPLSLLLLCAFSLGIVLGLFIAFLGWLSSRSRLHRLKKRNTLLQRELNNLRAMPAKDD